MGSCSHGGQCGSLDDGVVQAPITHDLLCKESKR